MSEENKVKEAMDVLREAVKKDDGYYMAWKANIAIAVYDELVEDGLRGDRLHNACNRGAKRFIKNCFDADHPVFDAG